MKLSNRPARTYDSFVNEFFNLPVSYSPVSKKVAAPANVYETKDAYLLELNVPGRNKEDFKVSIDKNLLTISYEASTTKENTETRTVRNEFVFESFSRSFTIDETIDANQIEAKYENGLLRFRLPKVEEQKQEVKTIAIQ